MNYLKLILLLMLPVGILPVTGQKLTVMTYNIRFNNPADGPNAWDNRKAWLCEQIQTVSPDFLGIQEGLVAQLNYMQQSLAAYAMTGVGRDDGREKGEFCALWYHKVKFRLLKHGTFWLSPTPKKVSKGWDAALPRICTYGQFRDLATGRKFWVFNTHFDHMGVTARKNSALLIMQKIKELNRSSQPVILIGDLNSEPDSEPIRLLKSLFQDAKAAEQRMSMDPDGTYNGFDTTKPATERIDYIFAGSGAKAVSYTVGRESRDGRYASDHFPVIAEIAISGN